MHQLVLITGGAGFIGSHLVDELLAHGYGVRVLDNLDPQVHGTDSDWPPYLNADAQRIRGDVRDAEVVAKAVKGVDAVVHLAAAVGVGQSMYQLRQYTDINQMGTATLLEALTNSGVSRLVVASSMSVYGEGLYHNGDGRPHAFDERTIQDLKAGRWEPRTAEGKPLEPAPTPESKPPALASNYALSKYAQERLCLIVGAAYGIEAVALRFFNVYGPRQALSNPYTGVLAIFASRFLNHRPPLIFEDGMQRRDFVHVRDIARACRLAIESPGAGGRTINIGTGRSITIRALADRLAAATGNGVIQPTITGRYRVGDIRHCFADISLARSVLGYEPSVALDDGLLQFADWLRDQVADDRVDEAYTELAGRGLAV